MSLSSSSAYYIVVIIVIVVVVPPPCVLSMYWLFEYRQEYAVCSMIRHLFPHVAPVHLDSTVCHGVCLMGTADSRPQVYHHLGYIDTPSQDWICIPPIVNAVPSCCGIGRQTRSFVHAGSASLDSTSSWRVSVCVFPHEVRACASVLYCASRTKRDSISRFRR